MAQKRDNAADYAKFLSEIKSITKSEISPTSILHLKTTLSSVNSMIAYKMADCFIDWLFTKDLITETEKDEAKKRNNTISPNANGFDVKIEGEHTIIAEIKCNVPKTKGSFQAQQMEHIITDINNLQHPEEKKKGGIKNGSSFHKFMVLLDVPEKDVKSAFEEITKSKTFPTDISFEIVTDTTTAFKKRHNLCRPFVTSPRISTAKEHL